MKKLIAGNWKMNGTLAQARALIADVLEHLRQNPALFESCDFVVCPPFLHISAVGHEIKGSGQAVSLGAQDCAVHENGAFTGDVSSGMLADYGISYVILGHSERRAYHGETSDLVADKARLAHRAGLKAIICIGEQEEERDSGRAYEVVGGQLSASLPETTTADNTVLAYEPVWAIGTGKSATPADIGAMHGFIREKIALSVANPEKMRILYGGSVKAENATEIFAAGNVDGALIGGASLKAGQYIGIARAAFVPLKD